MLPHGACFARNSSFSFGRCGSSSLPLSASSSSFRRPPQRGHTILASSFGSSSSSSSSAKKKRDSIQFLCSSCGAVYTQHYPKCPNCAEWNTIKEYREPKFEEDIPMGRGGAGAARRFLLHGGMARSPSRDDDQDAASPSPSSSSSSSPSSVASRVGKSGTGGLSSLGGKPWLASQDSAPQRLSSIRRGTSGKTRMVLPGETGAALNRVLGGGLFPGSLLLVGGEPGVGKSTLLLETAALLSQIPAEEVAAALGVASSEAVGPVLYVSGEESVEQIYARAERMSLTTLHDVLLWNTSSVVEVLSAVQSVRPRAVIVDSIQTMFLEDVNGFAGSPAQVRESAAALNTVAKATRIPMILIGHVTKSNVIAGPKVLEHMVDATLFLEGQRAESLRILRGFKNRFGSTDEVAVLRMADKGMSIVQDTAAAFLEARHNTDDASSAVGVVMNGTLPMVLEIQGLVERMDDYQEAPIRVFTGLDRQRIQQIMVILKKFLRVALHNADVLLNVVGGVRMDDPAMDLAIAAAICASCYERRIPQDVAFLGEAGLGGELRAVTDLERRVTELARVGFRRVLVPKANRFELPSRLKGQIEVIPCETIRAAMSIAVPAESGKGGGGGGGGVGERGKTGGKVRRAMRSDRSEEKEEMEGMFAEAEVRIGESERGEGRGEGGEEM